MLPDEDTEIDAMPENEPTPTEVPKEDGTKDQAFTQADVDRIVTERLQREKAKYADYDDLKKAAEGKKSSDERIAELEGKIAGSEARALRADVANRHGISAEDRELFLTGADEETLTAQAKRLAERESERKKSGNHVPNEGRTSTPPAPDAMREFTKNLFERASAE